MKNFLIFLIRVYQIGISPIAGGKGACRFYPTCSEYTRQAIIEHGAVRGCMMGARRICRCRPGGGKGYDPAE
ncbi:MAG: membrane protein insertion efficiency factor YidD [Rickettsiales bacterium]|nr:membrane protein insertion efficiency factor YidD [Rickettsiales bacterium]